MKRIFAIALFIAVVSWSSTQAAAPNSTDELIGFDKRRELLSQRKPEQAAKGREKVQAAEAVRSRVRGAKVDIDSFTGSPKWVHSVEDTLTGGAGRGKGVSQAVAERHRGDEHAAVKAFIDEHRTLFGHGPDLLKAEDRARDRVNKQTRVRTTSWRQRVDDIPVYEAVFISHVGGAGELLSVSSTFIADPERAANKGTPGRAAMVRNPAITAKRAIEIAAPVIGEAVQEITENEAQPKGAERAQSFRVKPLPGDGDVRLTWFAEDAETARLCWQVELTRQRFNERFRVLVDARTGEVLLWRKLTVEVQPVTYKVITNDSPMPMRPGHATPSAVKPERVQPTSVTLAALSTNASPLGWIHDGEMTLRGNNVDARLDRDADDRADIPRPTASLDQSGQRVFDFPYDSTIHPTNYSRAAAVQLFYWCNWAHDRLYDIGFDEAHGNFQKDNIARGGIGNDPIIADAQDGSGVNNANFTPTPDGTPARIQMYLFNGPNPPHDGTFDAEVVLHEYVHGMSDRRVGHGIGISQLQTYGMAEGWSDFFAEALLTRYEHDLDGNYPMGGYAAYLLNGLQESWYYGIRRYPYTTSTNVSPLMFQDIDPAQAGAYAGIPKSPIASGTGGEVHRQGEVWALMLWEVRAEILRRRNVTPETYAAENDFVMRLIADGMDWCPPNPTFVQARDGILAADRALGLGVGSNAPAIWTAFAKRGLGQGAVANDVTTTAGVVGTRAMPPLNALAVTPIEASFDGPAGGSFMPESASFTVRNEAITNVTWWISGVPPWLAISPTNGVLAGRAMTEVVITTNGFQTLPEGLTRISLTCSNSGQTNAIEMTVSINVRPATDSLSIDPTTTFEVVGQVGGPFLPTNRVYTLLATTNLNWYATNVPPWLTVSPMDGVLTPGETVDVSMTVNSAAAAAMPPGVHVADVSFVNRNTGRKVGAQAILHVGRDDFFVEDFNTRPLDLAWSTLTLTPFGDQYIACLTPATSFPNSTNGSTVLAGMRDDAYHFVTLAGQQTLPFFGTRTNGFWIGANGNITPDPGLNTNAYSGSLFDFFDRVRIAPLFADLNPEAGGSVSWQQLVDRIVVTWKDVPQFGTVSTNNIQLEVFFDGQIRMTWLELDLPHEQPYPVGIVGLSRGTGLPPNFVQSDLSASRDCVPSARLVMPTRVREGQTDVVGMLYLSGALTNDLLVTLTNDTADELIIPSTLLIAAGKTSVEVPMIIVDDTLLDGPQQVLLTASFSDRAPTSAAVVVEDNEEARITIGVPVRANEGDSTLPNGGYVFLGDLPIGQPAGKDLTVQLSSSLPGRLTVPAFVTIPAGQALAYFDLTVTDDELLNGAEQATITATVTGWEGKEDADTITIRDNESYILTLTPVASVSESGPTVVNGGFVSVSGIAVQPIAIEFSSERPQTLSVPGPVVIAPGTRSNSFSIVVSNNGILNSYDSVRLIASATNFTSEMASVTFLDDERPTPPANPQPADGATHAPALPLLSWSVTPLPDSTSPLRFFVYMGAGQGSPLTLAGVTTNANPRLQLTNQLLGGTTYYWQVVASNSTFTAAGPVWSFTTAGFDHFTVEPVFSPQIRGEPFQVTVTARDEYDEVLLNYTGTTRLTNFAPAKAAGTIAITEIDTSELDRVEFQNVSDKPINVSGWEIVCYDWTSWPEPKVSFTIPASTNCPPGGIFQLRTLLPRFAPGAFPTFIFPTNLFWNYNATNNPIAVLLRDNFGNIVDFVCAADADSARIETPRRVPRSFWDGPAVPVNLFSTVSYQRRGNMDNNNASDWATDARSPGTNNVNLAVPFTNYYTAAMFVEPGSSFISGRANMFVTVFDEVSDLILNAVDSQGRIGPGAVFDVLANNDLAVSVMAPDTVTVNDAMQCRIVVTNSGAAPIEGVWVTNVPPAFTTIGSAAASQGVCVVSGGRVVCNLGTLPGNSAASIVVEQTPAVPGMITNTATVTRSEPDEYEPNNIARAVTLAAIPQLTILDATNSEPFSDVPVTMALSVRLSVPSAVTTMVAFATSDQSAIAGIDYIPTNGVVIFPPGSTNQSIGVVLIPDTLSESNDTFAVTLSAPVNAQVTRAIATATIADNDLIPAIVVNDVTVTEGTSSQAEFRVVLDRPSGRVVTVGYYATNVTALAGMDYEPVYGTIVFTPGTTNTSVIVPVLNDTTWEPGKAFALVISNPGNAIITRGTGTATLLDDDTNDVHHLAFDVVPERPLVKIPFEVRGSARDLAGRVVTNFSSPVYFTATENEATRTVGTNTTPWNYPFSTSYHDARTEVIYLASELGAAGLITSLSLDITNMPGQMLRNFTIRTKATAATNAPIPAAWSSGGTWVTNFQSDVTIVSTGWVTFAFQRPFQFDGSNSLIVDFSFDNDSYSSDGVCRVTRHGVLRSVYARSDSAFGNPLAWSNNTAGVAVSSNVPNARFTIGGRIVVTPNVTTDVTNGLWRTQLTLDRDATNITLRAVDKAGRSAVYSGWSVIPDSDGDGMPDWWEIAYNFDPTMPGQQSIDDDGDGLTNGQEYLAGTDPRDRASALRILEIVRGPSGIVRVALQSVEGKRYWLDRADTLSNWVQSTENSVLGTGGTIYLYDLPTQARFYRVRVAP